MAGKRKKQRRWKKLQQSVLFRLRSELEYLDVRVMSNITVIILLVCIIAATVAWFTNSQSASVSGVNMTSADVADIEVSLTENPWEDIYAAVSEATGTDIASEDGTDEETTDENGETGEIEKQIEIKMPAFSNIYDPDGNPVTIENSNILAPGAYGTLTFYVKSVNEDCTRCYIYIDKNYLVSEDTPETITKEIDSIMQGHILCFAKRTETGGKYQYYNYLSADTPLALNLTYNKIEEITIYWVWPYEYTDLLEDCFVDSTGTALFHTPSDDILKSVTDKKLSDFTESSEDVLKMKEVYCWEKFSGELDRYLNAEQDGTRRGEYLEDWYDYADTMIGNYVTELSYKITVKGVMSDGE